MFELLAFYLTGGLGWRIVVKKGNTYPVPFASECLKVIDKKLLITIKMGVNSFALCSCAQIVFCIIFVAILTEFRIIFFGSQFMVNT